MPDGTSNTLRLPNNTHRVSVVGATGSGKSVFALWLLSRANIDRMPWLIIDPKRDENIALIKSNLVKELKPGRRMWRRKGLYTTHPIPDDDDDAIDDMLWAIWERGNCGVYIDEAHLLAKSSALKTLLVTGRSKKIPMIIVSQRPVDVTPYVFSQADFFGVFRVETLRDQKYVEDYLRLPVRETLPEYHCRWRDVGRNTTVTLSPVPPPKAIAARINALAPRPVWG